MGNKRIFPAEGRYCTSTRTNNPGKPSNKQSDLVRPGATVQYPVVRIPTRSARSKQRVRSKQVPPPAMLPAPCPARRIGPFHVRYLPGAIDGADE